MQKLVKAGLSGAVCHHTLNRKGRSPSKRDAAGPSAAGDCFSQSLKVRLGSRASTAGPLGCVPILCPPNRWKKDNFTSTAAFISAFADQDCETCWLAVSGKAPHQSSAYGLLSSTFSPAALASSATWPTKPQLGTVQDPGALEV